MTWLLLRTLSTRLDIEDFRDVILTNNVCVADLVREHNGKMACYMGDGTLAYFGHPEAGEDNADQAIHAALAIIENVARLKNDLGVELKVRIGIATGVVVVGDVMSDGVVRDRPLLGETTNLAARLQSLAEPNTVLIDRNTFLLAGGHFNYRNLGGCSVKGWLEPVSVWQVLGKSGVESRFEAMHESGLSPLFGREAEMELLLGHWRQAVREEGRVVVLTGEPGIGKSHIAVALNERLGTEPHITLRYFCSAHHRNSAFFPVISHIERAARFERGNSPAMKLSKLEALVRPSKADFLADLFALPQRNRHQPQELSPQKRKEIIFSALLALLESLAAKQPILLVFEDIHWIDPTTLELLTAIIERSPPLRIFVLLTARPEFRPPWPGYRHVTAFQLAPLDQRAGAALAEHIASGKRLPEEALHEILSRADGVPLFIEELTKTVIEAGVLHKAGDHYKFDSEHLHTIPRTLHGSLLARLDRLGPCREVAQIGATIGREFSYELLRAVAATPPLALEAALNRLVASGLVFRRCTSALTTYVFKHALVRDAAESTLLRSRRRDLHGTIAGTLEKSFPEIVEAQPELIARHYREANNVPKAVYYLSIAGDRALSRSALKEAHEQITQALKLISVVPQDDRSRDELKLQIALARTLLEQKGYADLQVGEAYARAHALSRRVGDTAMDLAVMYGLWAHHYIRGEPAAMLELANEFLTFANRQKEEGPIVVGHRLVGTSQLINGHMADAKESLDRAVVRYDAERHGSNSLDGRKLRALFGQDVGVTIYSYRSWALWLSGQPTEAQKAAEEALALSYAVGKDDQSQFYALWHSGMTYVLLGNTDKVAEIGYKLTELANHRDLPYWQALGSFLRGWWLGCTDRAADAIELLQGGLQLWAGTHSRIFRPICLAFLADAYAGADMPDLAYQTFDEALHIATETGERWAEPEIYRLFGDAFARYGRPAEAIEKYERAIAVAHEQKSRSFELRAKKSLDRVVSDEANTPRVVGRAAGVTILRAASAKP